MRGYEFPTNCRNFTQKYLTEVKIFQKSFRGAATFIKHPVGLVVVVILCSFRYFHCTLVTQYRLVSCRTVSYPCLRCRRTR